MPSLNLYLYFHKHFNTCQKFRIFRYKVLSVTTLVCVLCNIYVEQATEIKCYTKSNASRKCKGKGSQNVGNATVATRRKVSDGTSINEEERFDPSKPFHPGPLKLEIKSIRNSTRTESTDYTVNSLVAEEESGRSLITAAILVSWIFLWKWKAYVSFFIVHSIDFIWTSIKNLLGWGNEHYETTITLGNEHGHKGHRNSLLHHHPHGHHQDHHHGWPGWDGHHTPEKWVYKNRDPWHHPATKLFEQPTIQYLPHGKEYTLLGFDQHQAYKYRRKYGKKFNHYRRKYYRKKGKEIIKAQRQREREWKKAQRRKKKAARRKEKWERFKERVKEVQQFYDNLKKGSDDDDEQDDLKIGTKDEHVVADDKDATSDDLQTENKDEDDEEEDNDEAGVKEKEKVQHGDEEDEEDDDDDDEANDDLETEKVPEKDEDENDDLPHDDKSWQESSSEIEHGKPPSKVSASSYHREQDYDPLPTKSKNQKYIRIRI